MDRVQIKPQLLRWARERAGFDTADLERKFPRLSAWERGEAEPTLKQVEAFAKATYTPVGYLFSRSRRSRRSRFLTSGPWAMSVSATRPPICWTPSMSASKGRSGFGTMRGPWAKSRWSLSDRPACGMKSFRPPHEFGLHLTSTSRHVGGCRRGPFRKTRIAAE